MYAGGCGEQLDMFKEGTESAFGKYGPGISNYFKFLKWVFWIFVFACFITIPLLLLNIHGDNMMIPNMTKSPSDFIGVHYLAVLSLGYFNDIKMYNNTLLISLTDYSPVNYEVTFSSPDLQFMYIILDITICLMIASGYIWLRIFEKNEEKQLNKKIIQLSDYSIEIKNLPFYCTSSELYQHLNKSLYGQYPIVNIDFVYEEDKEDIENCQNIQKCIKLQQRLINEHRYKRNAIRSFYIQKALINESVSHDSAMHMALENITKELTDQCRVIDFEISKYYKLSSKQATTATATASASVTNTTTSASDRSIQNSKVKRAYVVFNDPIGAHMICDLYRKNWLFSDSNQILQGQRLDIQPAPEPTNIICKYIIYHNSIYYFIIIIVYLFMVQFYNINYYF